MQQQSQQQGPTPPGGFAAPPMPPYYPPPGMMPQQIVVAAPAAGRSFTRAIFTTLATTVFAASLALNLYLIMWSGLVGGGSAAAKQDVLIDGDPTQRVGVISVRGVIGADTFKKFNRMIAEAEADPNLKALVIDIDTPGGAVTASDQIYTRILRFKATMAEQGRTVPVIASIGSIGTSGGYYVACATDHIFAERTALTGNIGVLLPRFNFTKLADKYGIEETTIVSNGAPFKNAGSMFKPEKLEETAYIQKIADDAFAAFKDVVGKARTGKLTVPIETVTDGRAFFAPDADQLGLIDDTGSANDAYLHAAGAAKLSRPHVVKYEEPPSLLAALAGDAEAMGGAAITFDGNAVRVDVGDLGDLMTPRLMYLWRGE
jgi:protease-4